MAVQINSEWTTPEVGNFSTGNFIEAIETRELHHTQHGQYSQRGHKTAEIVFDPFFTTNSETYTYTTSTSNGLNLYNFLPGLRLLRYMDDGSGNLVYTITITAFMKNLDLQIATLDVDTETVNFSSTMSSVGTTYQWVSTTIEFSEAQAFLGSSTANDRRQHILGFIARINDKAASSFGDLAQIAVYEKILSVAELPATSPT